MTGGNVGEGTLGVVELVGDHVVRDDVIGLVTCEGDGDVVGVVTPLVRGVAQDFHGDQRSMCHVHCLCNLRV